jgi:hypothetical protein
MNSWKCSRRTPLLLMVLVALVVLLVVVVLLLVVVLLERVVLVLLVVPPPLPPALPLWLELAPVWLALGRHSVARNMSMSMVFPEPMGPHR